MSNLQLKIKKEIRAQLLSAQKGVPLGIFQQDYREQNGCPIPIRELGFSTVEGYLESIPDVVEITYNGNVTVLKGIPDKDTQHLAKLVQNQRKADGGMTKRAEKYIERRVNICSKL